MAKKFTVDMVEPLIDQYKGNIAAIARHLGCNRGTVWNRIQESANLQKALKNARETMLDNAESQLYNKVLAGDVVSLIYFLKTQGKSRGYIERVEQTGKDGGPLVVISADDLNAAARNVGNFETDLIGHDDEND